MKLNETVLLDIENRADEALDLLLELAQIPAPSNHEELRAEFCRSWLEQKGAKGVYIDEARNVIYPVNDRGDNPLMVFMAHSDVVFPDTTPLPLHIDNGRICCPGVGDDTANAVALLTVAAYIAEKNPAPRDCGLLLVINSGEEGLGNLRGSRKIMADFGHRVREFVTFDGNASAVVHRAVGSRRYRVTVRTQGGHSYGCFGRPNAIAHLSRLITKLYQIEVPPIGKTTYNVGTVSGGTSVNTIAQEARMLFEFRSDEAEALAIMENRFRTALQEARQEGVTFETELVGDRPCGIPVDETVQNAMIDRARQAVREYFGLEVALNPGSTDCNVPLSMGVPAICPGCVLGMGAHTREEYVEQGSLLPGLKVAFALILHHFQEIIP